MIRLGMVGTANRRILNIEPQNVEGWNRSFNLLSNSVRVYMLFRLIFTIDPKTLNKGISMI
jgi:hypothetical protein